MTAGGLAESSGLCCHPYDLCTELILREAGGIVMDEHRQPLSAPLDVTTGLSWMGFANAAIYRQVAPILRTISQYRKLIERKTC